MRCSKSAFILLIILLSFNLNGQEIKRPAIWGIAKITFSVSDFEAARNYYGKFLGFKECFSYQSDYGKVISFKVNNRQFLEFVQNKNAGEQPRMLSLSFETENAGQMRMYLGLKGIDVPASVTTDGAGNDIFTVLDPSGNKIDFIEFKASSLHKKSSGKFISDKRISGRIHHAGMYARRVQVDDPFYVGALNFRVIWRYPDDQSGEPSLLYLAIPECTENIELLSSGGASTNHPCFLVDDMQEAIYTLRERRENEILNSPSVGRGNRWLLNITDQDKIKVEFTESHTIR
jgi:catechol 2,3-dioxygenase-like lactoylglutathione lyase family enzyme